MKEAGIDLRGAAESATKNQPQRIRMLKWRTFWRVVIGPEKLLLLATNMEQGAGKDNYFGRTVLGKKKVHDVLYYTTSNIHRHM